MSVDVLKMMRGMGLTLDQAIELMEIMGGAETEAFSAPSLEKVWVYVLAEDYPGSDLVKVGISKHPGYRLEVLEKENRRNLYEAHAEGPFPRHTAYSIEQAAHLRLAEFRSRGEWFTCGVSAAAEAVRACALSAMRP